MSWFFVFCEVLLVRFKYGGGEFVYVCVLGVLFRVIYFCMIFVINYK